MPILDVLQHLADGEPVVDLAQLSSHVDEPQPEVRSAPYGFCPQCGAPGVAREKRPNGDDVCENGHHYASASSILPPVEHVEPEVQPELLPAPADAEHVETARNFISILFSARDRAHQLHLRTKSFSKHVALGELYQGLIDKADEIAEVVQGAHGIMAPVMGDVSSMTSLADTVDEEIKLFMDALTAACAAGHHAFSPADTFIHNLVDEVQALVYRTKYKLDNLA